MEVPYQVVSQRPLTQLNPLTQSAEEGLEVTFSYGDPGTIGTVFVSGRVPDPERARQLIEQYVENAHAVLQLGQ